MRIVYLRPQSFRSTTSIAPWQSVSFQDAAQKTVELGFVRKFLSLFELLCVVKGREV